MKEKKKDKAIAKKTINHGRLEKQHDGIIINTTKQQKHNKILKNKINKNTINKNMDEFPAATPPTVINETPVLGKSNVFFEEEEAHENSREQAGKEEKKAQRESIGSTSGILSPTAQEEMQLDLSRLTRDAKHSSKSKSKKLHLQKKLKKRKQKKYYSINKVGEVIYKGHSRYALMKSVQLGIKTSVELLLKRPKRMLNPDDYKVKVTLNFPKEGSKVTPAHNTTPFELKDYCPMGFRALRDAFGVSHTDYVQSICGEETLSVLDTPGKSGALFFFSANMKYILKTLTKKEANFLMSILPHYVKYCRDNKNTLLCRFYGLHRITPKRGRHVRFVVMNNIFQTHLKIHEHYDLKGSTVGRYASQKEKAKTTPNFKDMDLNKHIRIGPELGKELLYQLTTDAAFLAEMGIMDYSLLLGIHKRDPVVIQSSVETGDLASVEEEESAYLTEELIIEDELPSSNEDEESMIEGDEIARLDSYHDSDYENRALRRRERRAHSIFHTFHGGCLSEMEGDKQYVFFLGIIDILQAYNMRKKTERFFKGFIHNKGKISVSPPNQYSLRFIEFMEKIVETSSSPSTTF